MENDPHRPATIEPEREKPWSLWRWLVEILLIPFGNVPSDANHDTSWRWMLGIAAGIGLLAWFTR